MCKNFGKVFIIRPLFHKEKFKNRFPPWKREGKAKVQTQNTTTKMTFYDTVSTTVIKETVLESGSVAIL